MPDLPVSSMQISPYFTYSFRLFKQIRFHISSFKTQVLLLYELQQSYSK